MTADERPATLANLEKAKDDLTKQIKEVHNDMHQRFVRMEEALFKTANSVAGFEGMLKGILEGKKLNLASDNTNISNKNLKIFNRNTWIGIVTAIGVLITVILTAWPFVSKYL